MSSPKKENPSLLGQLLEMFGMSWPSDDPAPPPSQVSLPTCRSCGNPAPWSPHLKKWVCSNHPHAGINQPNE